MSVDLASLLVIVSVCGVVSALVRVLAATLSNEPASPPAEPRSSLLIPGSIALIVVVSAFAWTDDPRAGFHPGLIGLAIASLGQWLLTRSRQQ
jgi:hypothetical protein